MRTGRLGKLLSVSISLLLGCWLLILALPNPKTKPQEIHNQQTKAPAAQPLQAQSPATPTAIILPAPPPPPAPKRVVKAVESKPKPLAKPVLKIAPKPVKNAQKKPQPRPKKPEPTIFLATAGKKGLQEGRALLRILEHGAGPLIEIAWPTSSAQRDVLYKRFSQCFGMRIALVNPQIGLYVDEGPRGQKWDINLDRFSGFLRQPSGGLARQERSKVQLIRGYHGGLLQASPVRLFPRNVDALLLSGLGRIIGTAYQQAKQIRATYRLSGQRTFVDHIRVDGHSFPGTIDLSGAGRKCLRRV